LAKHTLGQALPTKEKHQIPQKKKRSPGNEKSLLGLIGCWMVVWAIGLVKNKLKCQATLLEEIHMPLMLVLDSSYHIVYASC
jgi:hypothetical protein